MRYAVACHFRTVKTIPGGTEEKSHVRCYVFEASSGAEALGLAIMEHDKTKHIDGIADLGNWAVTRIDDPEVVEKEETPDIKTTSEETLEAELRRKNFERDEKVWIGP